MIPQVVQSLSVGICNLGHELYPHLNSLECKERRQDKNWSSFSLVSLPCTSAAAGQADVLWGADSAGSRQPTPGQPKRARETRNTLRSASGTACPAAGRRLLRTSEGSVYVRYRTKSCTKNKEKRTKTLWGGGADTASACHFREIWGGAGGVYVVCCYGCTFNTPVLSLEVGGVLWCLDFAYVRTKYVVFMRQGLCFRFRDLKNVTSPCHASWRETKLVHSTYSAQVLKKIYLCAADNANAVSHSIL